MKCYERNKSPFIANKAAGDFFKPKIIIAENYLCYFL